MGSPDTGLTAGNCTDTGPTPGNGTDANEAGRAAAEARKIKSAIRAKQAGHPAGGIRHANGVTDHAAETFSAELSWLTRVSEAYARLK